MRKSIFGTFLIILISFINFSYLVNATTDLTNPYNSTTAPVNNFLLNFSWSNLTNPTDGYYFNNITFTLPTNLTAISGSNETNANNLISFAISGQSVSFGNDISWTTDTNAWFVFNINSNSSGIYTIDGTETYENVTEGTADKSNISTVPISVILNISKGTPSVTLYINGSNSNQTVNLNETVNLTAVSNVPELNVSLSLNPIYGDNFLNNVTPQTNLTNTSTLGREIFNFSAQVIGNENYSNSSLNTLYLFVTDVNFSDNSTNPSSGANYSPTTTYNFSIKLTGNISSVIFESTIPDGTLHYYTNNTSTNGNIVINKTGDTYWISFPALSAGNYQYKWRSNDTNNIWISTDPLTYVISPLSVPINLGVNGGWTTTTDTTVTITCSAGSYQVNLSIIGGCISGIGGNSISCPYPTGSNDGGSASFTCSVSPVYNYTGSVPGTLQWYKPSWNNDNLGGNPTTGSFTIVPSNSSVTIEPGSSKTVTLTLNNTLSSGYVMNISISVSGISSSWYSLDKTNITSLKALGLIQSN